MAPLALARMELIREASGDVLIVATTIPLLDLEDEGARALSDALRVPIPVAWPPEFNGDAYRAWQRTLLEEHPEDPGYAGWYVIGRGELVGTGGFKGPPNAAGEVEIGYSIIEPRRRRGFASGAVKLLVARAFRDPRVSAVLAETLPDLPASQGVLSGCGFTPIGSRIDAEDGEVLRFGVKR
jgi:ribosomal-protein-alanine N-acetyltransferase